MNKIYLFTCICILFISCSEKEKKEQKKTLDDCPVIAIRTDSLITLDFASVKDTFNIPLSPFLSDFEVIQLDNSPEALLGLEGFPINITDKYIGIYNGSQPDYKLFTRQGKYLRSISNQGQGPNEYTLSIWDSHIDEKNNKIYLLPDRTRKLLVFDLEGNPQEPVPLPYLVHKGRFYIMEDREELIMMVLPFPETTSIIWKQDFKGNILQEIDSTPFIIDMDYSNEIETYRNTDKYDFSLFHWDPTIDTLYHYDEKKNKLNSVFTTKWKEDDIIRHEYFELPDHYIVNLVLITSTANHIPQSPRIIINKKTLRGCYFNLKNNFLGNINGPNRFFFMNGYYIANIFPHELIEQLEAALAKPEKLSPQMKEKIQNLKNSLDEDDNNVLFLGKLKDS